MSAVVASQQPLTAQQLLNSIWDGTVPVNVVRLAERLGMTVRPNPLMADCGAITRRLHDVLLEYDPQQPVVRQRYAIAHLIGHVVLGHLGDQLTVLRDPVANYSTKVSDPKELAANDFALQLLLPGSTLRYAVESGLFNDVEHMARAFGVSQVALVWRLRQLGIVRT